MRVEQAQNSQGNKIEPKMDLTNELHYVLIACFMANTGRDFLDLSLTSQVCGAHGVGMEEPRQ